MRSFCYFRTYQETHKTVTEETTTTTDGQEPKVSPTPQAGQPTTDTAPQAGKGLSADELAAELKKTRDEAAKYRNERKELAAKVAEYEAKLKAEEDAKLTEQERITKEAKALAAKVSEYETRIAESEARSRALALRTAILEAAPKAGIAHAGMAVKLLDTSTLELGDDGTPKNLDAALKALLKEYPMIGGAPQTSVANPSRSEQENNPASREAYLRAKIDGQPVSPFDINRARSLGGGVVNRDDK